MAPHSWGQPWPPASGPAGRETPAEAPVAPQGSLCFLLLGRKHKEGGEQASWEKKMVRKHHSETKRCRQEWRANSTTPEPSRNAHTDWLKATYTSPAISARGPSAPPVPACFHPLAILAAFLTPSCYHLVHQPLRVKGKHPCFCALAKGGPGVNLCITHSDQ